MYDINNLKLLSTKIISESDYPYYIKSKMIDFIQNNATESQLKSIIMDRSITSISNDDKKINEQFNNYINEINNQFIQNTIDFINIARETIYNYIEETKEYDLIELKQMREFIFNESSSYQILSIVFDNNLPLDKDNLINERKYIEHINEEYKLGLICLSEQQITTNKKKNNKNEYDDEYPQRQSMGNAALQTGKEIGGMAGQLAMYSVVGAGVGKGIQKGGELIGKGYQAAKAGIANMSPQAKMATGGIALATMLGYGAYKAYENYLSKAARACANSPDKSSCIDRYKKEATQQQISKLQSSAGQCRNSRDENKCRLAIQNKVNKLKQKLF